MPGRPPHRPAGKAPAAEDSTEGQMSHDAFSVTADAHEYTPNPHDHEKGHKEPGKKGRSGWRPQKTGDHAPR